MSLHADPYALRYAASRFSAGAGELRRNASLILAHKTQLVSHDWKGTASQAFDVQSENQATYLRQSADVLEQAASVLNSLASQVEHVMELQRQAEQYERASWEYDGDTPDDLHHRQNLARQAAYYRQQAEFEARQADSMASGQLHQIMAMIPNVMNRGSLGTRGSDDFDDLPEPMRSYYKRHPELREDGVTSTSMETDVSLPPEQKHRAHKEEVILHEMEQEQKPLSIEDLLVLYYITKRDFNQFVSPEDMIEQDLKLDGITTEEQLREHVAMQIKINQENDEIVRFCSQPENYGHPKCVVFKYNQAGGMEPVSIGIASMATAKVLSMGAKKIVSTVREKVFAKTGEFVKVALPEGESFKARLFQASDGEGSSGVKSYEGVRIINKKFAGQTYMLEGELAQKYPNGVKFSEEGFPDFTPYAKVRVEIVGLKGNTTSDFTAANRAVGLKETPKGYTWHHVEDGKTMMLLPTDLHQAVRHTGGAALIRKGLAP